MKNSTTITLLVITLLSIQAPLNAQVDSLWAKTYGGEWEDACMSMILTDDNGFALAGIVNFNHGVGNYGLVRTDSEGNEIWSRYYGGMGMDWCYDVVQCTDGGFLLIGTSDYLGRGEIDLLIIRTDDEGDSLYSLILGLPGQERCNTVINTEDGGFAVGGSTFIEDSENFWLVRLDEDCEPLWTKTYGRDDEHEECRSMVQTDDGGFVLGGNAVSQNPTDGDFMLIKTDANGDSLWSIKYGIGNEWFSDLRKTSDGGFVLAGTTQLENEPNFQFWLVRTDLEGETLWTKAYAGLQSNECKSVIETSDGGFVLVGNETTEAGKRSIRLIRASSEGDSLWTFTAAGDVEEQCYQVIETDDGGYALAGVTRSYGAGAGDYYLIKTTPDPAGVVDRENILQPSLISLSSFPSPFNSSIRVTLTSPFPGEARASLMDVSGRLVSGWVPANAGTRSGSPGEVRFIVNGAGLSAGTYWLKVEQGGRAASTRLVLVK